MSEYTELCRELRNTERICRDRMDGEVMLKAADAIEELEKKMLNWQATADDHWEAYQHWFHKYMDDMPKWIPVTERLPEFDKIVLVSDGHDVDTGWVVEFTKRDGEKKVAWASPFADFDDVDSITHWMPLPTPPKEETEWAGKQ